MISVAPGTYRERLVVTKPNIRIRSPYADARRTVITSVEVRAPGFQVENVTIGPVAASSATASADSCQARSGEAWARGVEGQRRADQGDGCYLNPIFPGDHPDPSVLKDGDDYYMTFSSFDAYPGLVVWHSRDLVNWQPIGPALLENVGSVWAPDLVRHAGRYFIYFPARTRVPLELRVWADHLRARGASRST